MNNMLFLLSLTLLAHISSSQLCDSTDYAQKIEKKLKHRIGHKYSITKGSVFWIQNFSIDDNNPSGIYGVYLIPFSSETTFNDNSGDLILHCHDAVVFAGCTPPQSKYYSVVSYLFNRFNINKTNVMSRKWIFGSLGASLNHLLINTTNGTFNSLATVIHTGDNMTFTDIYHSLYDEQQNYNDINLQIIPNDYFNFAPYSVDMNNFATYPLSFDSYYAVWRIAIPSNKKEYNQYINTNQTVFYLRYKNVSDSDDNIPFQGYVNNTSNSYSPYLLNETSIYYDDFIEYSHDLITNISSTYNYSFVNVTSFNATPDNLGYFCINRNQGCLGDNSDATYSITPKTTPITDDDYFIVIGVNSYNFNLTVYQNIAYHLANGTASPFAITNFQYKNTAIDLNIPSNVNLTSLKNFWVVQFARPATFIPNIMGFNISYKDVGKTDTMKPVTRDYLNPLTKTRPYRLDLLSPLFIRFKAN